MSRKIPPTPPIVVRADGALCRAEFIDADWICPLCRDRFGVIEIDADGYEAFRPCSCQQARRRIDLFNGAKLGSHFKGATLDSFRPRSPSQSKALSMAADFAQLYVGGVKKGYLFWGEVGTGKTHLAVGMFRKLTLDYGVPCRFVDYSNLLQDLRRSYRTGQGDADVMLPLVDTEVLVIDELARGQDTDWELTVLDDLIGRRYNAGLVTLFTTNHLPESSQRPSGGGLNRDFWERQARSARSGGGKTLLERVGDRIYSRLCEMCEFVYVGGEDFRRRDGPPTRGGAGSSGGGRGPRVIPSSRKRNNE